MLFMIVFGLLFLIGTSLFAAFVGTSILKKNARVVRVPRHPGHPSGRPERPVPGPYRAYPAPGSAPPPHGFRGYEEEQAGPADEVGPGSTEQPPKEEEPGPDVNAVRAAAEQLDYRSRFTDEYRDDIEGLRKSGAKDDTYPDQGPESGAAFNPAGFPPAGRSPGGRSSGPEKSRGAGLWVLAGVLVVAIFAGSLYATIRDWPSQIFGPRMVFCEAVDFSRLKPVHRSDTFTRGNLTLFVKAHQPLGMREARIEVYRLGEQQEPYAEKTVPLKPSWMSFAVKLLFEDIGSYRVSVLRSDGTPMDIDHLNIVPDSFAYRPVAVKED